MKNIKTILLTTMMIAPALASEQDIARAIQASLLETPHQEGVTISVEAREEAALNAARVASLREAELWQQEEADFNERLNRALMESAAESRRINSAEATPPADMGALPSESTSTIDSEEESDGDSSEGRTTPPAPSTGASMPPAPPAAMNYVYVHYDNGTAPRRAQARRNEEARRNQELMLQNILRIQRWVRHLHIVKAEKAHQAAKEQRRIAAERCRMAEEHRVAEQRRVAEEHLAEANRVAEQRRIAALQQYYAPRPNYA